MTQDKNIKPCQLAIASILCWSEKLGYDVAVMGNFDIEVKVTHAMVLRNGKRKKMIFGVSFRAEESLTARLLLKNTEESLYSEVGGTLILDAFRAEHSLSEMATIAMRAYLDGLRVTFGVDNQ